jgi:hypothetical protein
VDDKSFLYGGDFSTTTFRQRLRIMLKATVPINHTKMDDNTWYAQAFDEVFVSMGPTTVNTNLLDQNRIMIGLGYKFNKFYAIEAGYLRQTIFRFNNIAKDNVDVHNVLLLNFVVNNIEQLLAKPAKK